MANSIVKRIVRLFRANTHELLNQLEDPGVIGRQLINELSAELAKHEEAVSSVIAEQKQLEKRRDAAKAELEKWEQEAETAVKANRDDLAEKCLERVERADINFQAFDKTLASLSPKVERLIAQRDSLRKRRDDARNEVELLTARAKAAEASSRASKLLGEVESNPIDFSGLKSKVDMEEAKSEALEELVSRDTEKDLESEMAALRPTPLSERLQAIKAKVSAEG